MPETIIRVKELVMAAAEQAGISLDRAAVRIRELEAQLADVELKCVEGTVVHFKDGIPTQVVNGYDGKSYAIAKREKPVVTDWKYCPHCGAVLTTDK